MTNILPYTHRRHINKLRCIRGAIGVLLGIAILMGISAILLLPTARIVNARYLMVNEQLYRLKERGVMITTDDLSTLQGRLQGLEQKLAGDTPTSPLYYVGHLRAYEGNGIRLIGYNINATSGTAIVSIKGVASTRERLQQFLAAVQADPAIAIIDSPVASFVKDSESPFTTSITFKSI